MVGPPRSAPLSLGHYPVRVGDGCDYARSAGYGGDVGGLQLGVAYRAEQGSGEASQRRLLGVLPPPRGTGNGAGSAGFRDVQLLAVEGFAWLMGDLPQRMAKSVDLLRALRLTESEPSMLGVSAHL